MAIQSEISAEILSKKIGKKLEVLIEEEVDEENYIGRTYMDSPEIDGVTYVHSDKNLEIGSFVQVNVVDSLDYDLVGEII